MSRRTAGRQPGRGRIRLIERVAREYERAGWQLVPQRRQGGKRPGNVPVTGTTGGRTEWLDAAGVLAAVRDDPNVANGADLVAEPGERGPAGLLPGVRMPPGVIAIDVDHYGDKRGADTIGAIEEQCGPLPATWTITARGPDSPARRHLFRIPTDVVVTDRWFSAYGGDVDVLRTSHRYSHAPGARHLRTGTPVVCYAPDGAPLDGHAMPPVGDLPELPPAWCKAIREFYAEQGAVDGSGLRADGPPELLTESHAEHIVAQARDRLEALPPVGGDFRNAVYGLARVCALHARTFGEDVTADEAVRYALGQFDLAHPGLVPDGDDEQWIREGVARAWSLPGWEIDEEDEPDDDPPPRTRERERERDRDRDRDQDDEQDDDEPRREREQEPLSRYERELALAVRRERMSREARAAVDAEQRPDRPSLSSRAIDVRALADVPPTTMMMERFLPDSAVGVLAGKYGTYKSFLAVSWACHLALGRPWLGRDEFTVRRPVNVLYVAAEGAAGIAERIRAWEAGSGVEIPAGKLTVYPVPVHLNDAAAVAELEAEIAERNAGLIVVDTYRRSAPGVEDNSTKENGMIFETLARIRDQHGVTILVIDHTGHRGDRPRGASSKMDDADFGHIVTIEGEGRDAGAIRTLSVEKLKDRPSYGTWPLVLRPVPRIGEDGSGYVDLAVGGDDPVSLRPSCWAIPTQDLPEPVRGLSAAVAVREAAQDVFRALVEASDVEGLTVSQMFTLIGESPREHKRTTAYGAVKALVSAGVLEPTDRPKNWILTEPYREWVPGPPG